MKSYWKLLPYTTSYKTSLQCSTEPTLISVMSHGALDFDLVEGLALNSRVQPDLSSTTGQRVIVV